MLVHYSSIENHYKSKFIDKIKQNVDENEQWVVTEKADGSNFSVIGNRDGEDVEVKFAKRTSLVETEADIKNFFDFDMIKQDLTNNMLALMSKYPDVQKITVFGELIGGHHGFKEKPQCKTIAKIPYTNMRGYLAFDVVFDNVYQSLNIVETCGFFTVPVVMVGTLDECLQFDVENYRTKMPYLFNHHLEDDYPFSNMAFAEGVVIRPIEPKYLPNKSRVIIKMKHPKHADKEFRKATTVDKPKTTVELSEELNKFIEDILCYLNQTRFDSVLNKDPNIKNNKTKFKGLIMQDMYDTYKRDGSEIPEMNKKEKAEIYKLLQVEIDKLLNSS